MTYYLSKRLLCLWTCLCACSAILTGQNLPNNAFINQLTDTCRFDSMTRLTTVEDWVAFQTLDSTRWGPQDSTCIPTATAAIFAQGFLRGNDLDRSLPVYFNASLKDRGVTVPLDSNNLYKVWFNGFSPQPDMWRFASDCKEDFCSGIEIGIEIPDSAGTGTTTRWYSAPASAYNYGEFCFPTEYFPSGNNIARFWAKFTPEQPQSANDSTVFFSVDIEDMRWSTEQIRELEALYNGFNYEVFLSQFSGGCLNFACPNKLLMYGDTTYPSAANPSFVDINPVPNSTSQETIDVILDFGTYMTAQPFTTLRGGLVQGDTLRHNYNLINNGAEVCNYGLIELVFELGNNYIHNAGKVTFSDARGCMMFGKGSALIVPDGVHFDFGKRGNGLLALRTGGKLDLGKDSQLTIYNTLNFCEYYLEEATNVIEIELNRGSRLVFAPGSHLTNELSKDPNNCFLTVHMNGGYLDDSNLSPEERALIRRVYTTPAAEFEANVAIHSNPVDEDIELSVIGHAGEELDVAVWDAAGKNCFDEAVLLQEGTNDLRFQVDELPQGVYFLKLQKGQHALTERILKL